MLCPHFCKHLSSVSGEKCDVKATLIYFNIFIVVFACSNEEPRCECQDLHVNCTNLGLERVPRDIEEEITWL